MKTLFPEERVISKRPITMTSDSIDAVEAGLKTQTRRIIYPAPNEPALFRGVLSREKWGDKDGTRYWTCQYGQPGDLLWVRQIWARVEPFPGVMEKYDLPFGSAIKKSPALEAYWRKRIIFLRDFPGKNPEDCGRGATDNVWRSPVTLPWWASRLWLEITEVRPERLMAISAADCEAEGVSYSVGGAVYPAGYDDFVDAALHSEFAKKWNGIHGRKHPWSENPWVWAVTFRKLDAYGQTEILLDETNRGVAG